MLNDVLTFESRMISNSVDNSRYVENQLQTKKIQSRSRWGEALSSKGYGLIKDHIEYIKKESESGRAGVGWSRLKPLNNLPTETIAATAIRTIIDTLTLNPTFHTVGQEIADRLWIEAMLERLNKDELARYNRSRQRKRHKIKGLQHMTSTVQWTAKERMAIGGLLIYIVEKETGFIKVERDDLPHKKRRIIKPTVECMEWINDIKDKQGLLIPHYLPTIAPGAAFNEHGYGGYHDSRLQIPLLKSNNDEIVKHLKGDEPCKKAPEIFSDVGWTINEWILEQAISARDNGWSIGVVQQEPVIPPYPKGKDDDSPEVLAWRKTAKKQHILEEKTRGSRIGLAWLLHIANDLKEQDELFLPCQLDSRGRIYYRPPYLNPQGNDLSRALLQFSYYNYMQTDEHVNWLRVHGANVYGLGKAAWQTRIDWVTEHEQLILAAGNDPWLSPSFWTRAEKPWSFLAFCRTYWEWKQEGPTYKCRHPIIMDCTCSGVQNFAGLLRSQEMAEQVNLTQSDKPQDIYAAVVGKINERLRLDKSSDSRKWLMLQPDRSLTKAAVMTIPYAATYTAFYKYAYEWGIKRAKDLYGNSCWLNKSGSMSTTHYMARILHEESARMIRPAVQAMKWFKAVGVKAGKCNVPLRWTTPSGLLVHQQYNSTKDNRVRLKYLSDIYLDIRVQEDCPTLNTIKMGNSLTANVLHSLDSSLMSLCTLKSRSKNVINIGGIHDAFITDPTSMSVVRDAAKESFVEIYKDDWLTKIKDTLKAQLPIETQVDLPSEPQLGDFDPTSTLNSNYFIT